MLIDTHCHLTMPALIERIDAVIVRARDAGVGRMVVVAVNPDDAREALALMRRYADLYLVAGVHPHEAARCGAQRLADLRDVVESAGSLRSRIVGIGETGIDLHYDFAPQAQQEAVFLAQLQLAVDLGLPVVIHARLAERRVSDILADHSALARRTVFHCYSGDPAVTRRILDLGCYCSFTGVVTFKKAENIRAAARMVPADRIMLETDAPYLAPEPVRKVHPNEPALLVHTARFLAALRGEDEHAFAEITSANAIRFFNLPKEAP